MATLLIRVNDARRSAAPPPDPLLTEPAQRLFRFIINKTNFTGMKLITMLITLRKRYVVYIIVIFISFDCFLAFGEYECSYYLSETDLKQLLYFHVCFNAHGID